MLQRVDTLKAADCPRSSTINESQNENCSTMFINSQIMLCRKSWILETPLFRNHSSVISLLYDPLNKRKQLTDLVKKSSTPALTSVSTTMEMKSKWPEIIVLTVLAISVQLSVGFGFGKHKYGSLSKNYTSLCQF